MSLLITDVTAEPVTLEEVKLYSKIETPDEDVYIGTLISACRREIEDYCGIALAEQVIQTVHDGWPLDERGYPLSIWSPRVPVASVVVSVVDEGGSSSTAVEAFSLRKGEGRLRPVSDVPDAGTHPDSLTIDWTVGYSVDTQPLPPQLKDALLSLIDYRWVNRGSSSGGIPADLCYKINSYKVHQI